MKRFLSCALVLCALSLPTLAGDSHEPGYEDPPPDSTQTSPAAPSGFEWVWIEGVYVLVSLIG